MQPDLSEVQLVACSIAARRLRAGSARRRQMAWASGARPGMNMNLLCYERRAALGADHDRVEILAAWIVPVQQRPALPSGHMDIAPVDDRHDDRIEVEPFLGQTILVPHRTLLVGHLNEDELVDQLLQAVGEDRSGNAEALLEILKAPDT